MKGDSPAEEPLIRLIICIFITLLLRAFFALVETAFTSSRKPRLRSLGEAGNRNCLRALKAAEHQGPFLFTVRSWIITLEIFTGALGIILAGRILPGPFLPALCVLAFIILAMLILGDLIPRQIARLAPEGITAALFPLMAFLIFLAGPFFRLSSWISGLVRVLFRLGKAEEPGMTEDELRIALLEGERSGIMDSDERTMVEGVFYLGDRPVETFMTHRSELKWLDINAGAEEAKKAALEFSDQHYFPVALDTLDKVAGIVSVRDILVALLDHSWNGLKPIMTPPWFIPQTMSALKAFESFKREDRDFLCVIDEYGGFAGALTVRNLIEEIVGELSATGGGEEEILLQDDGTYLADGSVNMDDIAERLFITELLGEHQNYHTLAGFILLLAGEIPRTGAVFTWNGFRFKIVDMDGNRIDKVMIYPPEKSQESALP
ncbi:MAG: hemolysin family protein [Spirochaetaceae bacterium]|jgi:putative hemolysin|nr:hemolysin family protein [Spirochaetaceae bacterium]